MTAATRLDPEDQVRAIWAAYARGGLPALRRHVGPDVEWAPLAAGGRTVTQEELWGEWGRRQAERTSAVVHGYQTHGSCVLAHGSLRTFRDGGFVDVQPSWVYFFRDGTLVRGAGYLTRAEALAAIAAFDPDPPIIRAGSVDPGTSPEG